MTMKIFKSNLCIRKNLENSQNRVTKCLGSTVGSNRPYDPMTTKYYIRNTVGLCSIFHVYEFSLCTCQSCTRQKGKFSNSESCGCGVLGKNSKLWTSKIFNFNTKVTRKRLKRIETYRNGEVFSRNVRFSVLLNNEGRPPFSNHNKQ